jgi:hypothetical protein
MNLPHLHLLLNHWPIIGTFVALGALLIALIAKSEDLKQASLVLFAGLALLSIPTYLSGNAAEEGIKSLTELRKDLIETHEGVAFLAFISMEITGLFALAGLWRFSRITKDPSVAPRGQWSVPAVLILAVVTSGLMALAGNTGGNIRHPEIASGEQTVSTIGTMGMGLIKDSEYFVIDTSRWIWPMLEDLHFIGLILLLSTVGLLDLRILGFFKQLPVAPLHRFIPLGIAGFVINVVTGFLFFIGMPYFYVGNWIFQLKILVILMAGANLLLFHCTGTFRAWARLGPGEEAPGVAKFIAVTSILLWLAVIIIGRYIPLGESI